jgi:hypothetical protein
MAVAVVVVGMRAQADLELLLVLETKPPPAQLGDGLGAVPQALQHEAMGGFPRAAAP